MNNNKTTDNKVAVKCTVNHTVSINVRSVPFAREWLGKGAVQKIEMDVLEQIMYDPGVRYMFETGMLYIEEMEPKQALGLEPEQARTPVNIIVLDDKQKRDCLIKLPFNKFTELVDKLSIEQVRDLAQYAIDNNMMDLERDDYIKEKCGRDIIATIRLNKSEA